MNMITLEKYNQVLNKYMTMLDVATNALEDIKANNRSLKNKINKTLKLIKTLENKPAESFE